MSLRELPRSHKGEEKIGFPGAISAEGKLRNLEISGMGKPGRHFPARDRVGPSHGIP
jgi:hypothetical protein